MTGTGETEEGSMRSAFEEAAQRVTYRLTFGRTPESRVFSEDGSGGVTLEGPPLPHAAQEGAKTPGGWLQPPDFMVNGTDCRGEDSQASWLSHFFSMAINEAVHEALEYFRVDGKLHLDPHGPKEERIYLIVNELAAQLAELAEEG